MAKPGPKGSRAVSELMRERSRQLFREGVPEEEIRVRMEVSDRTMREWLRGIREEILEEARPVIDWLEQRASVGR